MIISAWFKEYIDKKGLEKEQRTQTSYVSTSKTDLILWHY